MTQSIAVFNKYNCAQTKLMLKNEMINILEEFIILMNLNIFFPAYSSPPSKTMAFKAK